MVMNAFRIAQSKARQYIDTVGNRDRTNNNPIGLTKGTRTVRNINPTELRTIGIKTNNIPSSQYKIPSQTNRQNDKPMERPNINQDMMKRASEMGRNVIQRNNIGIGMTGVGMFKDRLENYTLRDNTGKIIGFEVPIDKRYKPKTEVVENPRKDPGVVIQYYDKPNQTKKQELFDTDPFTGRLVRRL